MFKRTIKTLIVMLLTISMTMPIANVKAYEENYERNVMPARDYDKFDDNFKLTGRYDMFEIIEDEELGYVARQIEDQSNIVPEENGYTIVKEIGGHGVGLEFHEDPWVSYTSEENSGVIMEPGMMFTIEPMVNMGSDEVYTDEEDDWTVRTEDGMPSAQWEVTVLVTEDGCEVICW